MRPEEHIRFLAGRRPEGWEQVPIPEGASYGGQLYRPIHRDPHDVELHPIPPVPDPPRRRRSDT